MTNSKTGRILLYAIMLIVVWSILMVVKLAGLDPFTWWWWAISEFVPQTSMAIATSTIAVLSGMPRRGAPGFMHRMKSSLLTALFLSVSFGSLAWLFSLLPSVVRVPLGVMGLLASLAVTFSAALAAAHRIPPLEAILTSARFVFSKPGIKLILLMALIGGVPGAAYPVLAKYSGWQPASVQLLFNLFAVTSVTTGILIAGVVIWRRFGTQEA